MTLYDDSLRLLAQREQMLDPYDYNIVFIGDSWVGDQAHTSNDIFESALTEAKLYNPLLVLHGGDTVFSGLQTNFEYFINFKNQKVPELPLFVAVGNHEMDLTAPPGLATVANFEQFIGPLHFTLTLPRFGLTIIVLNTLYEYVYKQYGLTDTELAYLRESLSRRLKNTFVAMHTPPRTNDWVKPDDVFTIGSAQFFAEVEGKIQSALVSHVHAFDTDTYAGTKLILSGGGGATLNKKEIFHIVVININNDRRFKRVSYKVVPIGWT